LYRAVHICMYVRDRKSTRTKGRAAKQTLRSGVPRAARGAKHAPCNSDQIGFAIGEDREAASSRGILPSIPANSEFTSLG
jgi:hypothetical protein